MIIQVSDNLTLNTKYIRAIRKDSDTRTTVFIGNDYCLGVEVPFEQIMAVILKK